MATRADRPGAQQWVPESTDIDELKAAAPDCRGCELWEPATQVVFSAGNPAARIVLVGEQPGDIEDRRGIPFVGPAGQLLQEVLEEAGIPRKSVYVTNAVKHFRFTEKGKRRIHQTPDMGHVNACRPWLTAELRAVSPDLVVLLGATAAKSIFGSSFRITQSRGQVIEQETTAGTVRFLATAHPSAILRTDPPDRPAARAALLADLRTAAGVLVS